MLTRSKSRFHSIRLRLENHVPSSRFHSLVWEFSLFIFKQGWACLFGGMLLALLLVTQRLWPPHAPLARYDFLFLAALLIQASLLMLRMETVREAKVILMFHVVGTCMELFKTRVGSWTYPEASLIRIGHVPLFSGFMYASVGSYLARTTRIFDMRYLRYPRRSLSVALAALIYANFFFHHFMPDIRFFLFAAVIALFGPTMVYFRPYRSWRKMPLILGFALVTVFLWVAENIGTFTHAWLYPQQTGGWRLVDFQKYGSWFLLMIISFVLVSFASPPMPPDRASEPDARQAAEFAVPEPAEP